MAEFLTEMCPMSPPFQPLTGKHLVLGSANREDGACLDIPDDNFCHGEETRTVHFDTRMFSAFVHGAESPKYFSQSVVQEK